MQNNRNLSAKKKKWIKNLHSLWNKCFFKSCFLDLWSAKPTTALYNYYNYLIKFLTQLVCVIIKNYSYICSWSWDWYKMNTKIVIIWKSSWLCYKPVTDMHFCCKKEELLLVYIHQYSVSRKVLLHINTWS